MLPHARKEVRALARHSKFETLDDANGWKVQSWELTQADVDRVISAYQALLTGVDLDDELSDLLSDMGLDPLGEPATTEHHAKLARADAMELVGAATLLAIEDLDVDDLHMPNVPKMAGKKSDSGIDVIGVELNPSATGEPGPGERLVICSVKHTVGQYASGMRNKLESSVGADMSAPYLLRQLTTLHGRMVQSGIPATTADRVLYFLRDTLNHPGVRVVCVAASAPVPDCNLPDQPTLLEQAEGDDMHFRMILVPDLSTLHEKLLPE